MLVRFPDKNKYALLCWLPLSSYDVKVIILPLVHEGMEWIKLPRLTVLDEDRNRSLEVLRLKDNLRLEGPDLPFRMPTI